MHECLARYHAQQQQQPRSTSSYTPPSSSSSASSASASSSSSSASASAASSAQAYVLENGQLTPSSSSSSLDLSFNFEDASDKKRSRSRSKKKLLAQAPVAISSEDYRECDHALLEGGDGLEAGSRVPTFGIALHGEVWKKLLTNDQLLDDFFDLASHCRSVIACRLEPKEKADIVARVKAREQTPCLAIGDGNNDTPMIKTADLGVGIRGVEGNSAVAAADYAISQFRFLERLLLVYGRLNYRRIATLINFIFYKSSVVVWTVFFFGAYSCYSGQFLYLDSAFQLHNVAYTAFPILVFAVLDRDLEPHTLNKHPTIYMLTRGHTLFSTRIFASWLLWGFLHACICFFVPWFSFSTLTTTQPDGLTTGIWSEGLVVYTCIVFVSNLRLLLIFQSWTWLHWLTLFSGFFFFFISMIIFSATSTFAIGGADYYGVLWMLLRSPRYYLTVVLTTTIAFILDFAAEAISRVFAPSATDLIVLAERSGRDVRAVLHHPHIKAKISDSSAASSASAFPVICRDTRSSSQEQAHSYTGANFDHTPYRDYNGSVHNLPESASSSPLASPIKSPSMAFHERVRP